MLTKNQEWVSNGCKTVIVNGLYSHYCSECGRSEKDHKKQYENGYYTRTITTYCKCGNKYEYTS